MLQRTKPVVSVQSSTADGSGCKGQPVVRALEWLGERMPAWRACEPLAWVVQARATAELTAHHSSQAHALPECVRRKTDSAATHRICL
jgi:hypothetical protein